MDSFRVKHGMTKKSEFRQHENLKIGVGLMVFILLILGISAYSMIQGGNWEGLLPMLLFIIFIIYLFTLMSYSIEGNILIVKCGFLMNKSFEINRITNLTESNNPIGATATSLDRLVIAFDNSDSVVISPKQKYDFIDHLIKLNPNIIVTLKSKKREIDNLYYHSIIVQ